VKPRTILVISVTGLALVVMLLSNPIPQDPAYHQFADTRIVMGIPNFWNVISNAPFLLVGLLGLHAMRSKELPGGLPELRPMYFTFFIGVACVAFGSGYYHWSPSNMTLVWDRLPMTVAFMAFFCAIIGERVDIKTGCRLLLPLACVGIGSVIYWYLGELHGAGDLRPYALVQFLPMLLIPIVLFMYPTKLSPTVYLWGVLAAYAASKLAEFWDGEILQGLGGISGHSLKHLLAALGTYLFLLALQRRHVVEVGLADQADEVLPGTGQS
jgi:hypothetical protein